MFVSHHTLKWTRTCRSHGRHPHAHTAHFLLNRHRRLDDRKAPLSHEEAEEARALASRGRALLDEAGDPRWNPDSYRPRDPDEELKLAKRLEGIARERDLDSLEQLDRLTATIRATIGPRGGMRP